MNERNAPLKRREAGAALELYAVLSEVKPVEECRYLGKLPTKRKQHEGSIQAQLFKWAADMTDIYPELRLLYHIPNGGKRDAIEGAHLKQQGVKAGVPDIHLPVPRGAYHGMFVEIKAPGGRMSDNQRQWLHKLNKQGYRAVECHGLTEAQTAILDYLNVMAE